MTRGARGASSPCRVPPREARRTGHVCGLRESDPRPVHPARLPGPGVARRLPEVRRVQPVPGRVLHLLCARRQNLLQERLCKVWLWEVLLFYEIKDQ